MQCFPLFLLLLPRKKIFRKKQQHSFSDCFPGRFHECLRLSFASFTDEKNCPVRSDLKDSRMKQFLKYGLSNDLLLQTFFTCKCNGYEHQVFWSVDFHASQMVFRSVSYSDMHQPKMTNFNDLVKFAASCTYYSNQNRRPFFHCPDLKWLLARTT